VAFLAKLVAEQPRAIESHLIAENLSAHKTGKLAEFLERHRNAHMHFTTTYWSWLNQVELRMRARDVTACSAEDLRRLRSD